MQERCQYIKGYVGNVCAFPQADGGLVLLSLPPNQQQVSEHLLNAFVGSDEDRVKQFLGSSGLYQV